MLYDGTVPRVTFKQGKHFMDSPLRSALSTLRAVAVAFFFQAEEGIRIGQVTGVQTDLFHFKLFFFTFFYFFFPFFLLLFFSFKLIFVFLTCGLVSQNRRVWNRGRFWLSLFHLKKKQIFKDNSFFRLFIPHSSPASNFTVPLTSI